MITSTLKIASAAALIAISTAFSATLRAQTFSRPVILMSGIVRSDETAQPTSVKVSIREVGDTTMEITCSTSNKETGRYLVVLQPAKKYWVHLEGDSVLTKDILIATPPADQTQQLPRDFTVALRETDDATATKASSPQN
ncbi:MAG TPA: hypothetical protein VFH95_14595 [Candidatus Kapabacteria bacterium]|nr:hypothetical protein [Candidatus Kapabacteria bacterium]